MFIGPVINQIDDFKVAATTRSICIGWATVATLYEDFQEPLENSNVSKMISGELNTNEHFKPFKTLPAIVLTTIGAFLFTSLRIELYKSETNGMTDTAYSKNILRIVRFILVLALGINLFVFNLELTLVEHRLWMELGVGSIFLLVVPLIMILNNAKLLEFTKKRFLFFKKNTISPILET